MENSAEDYRIQSFDLDTQRLLKTALKGQPLTSSCVSFLDAVKKKALKHMLSFSDPSLVNLEKVSNIIVDQSLKDTMFSKEAGRICYTIVQVSKTQLYIAFRLPLFVHPPTVICLTLCLTLSAG